MIAGYSTSRHLLEDRSERLIKIATTVGFGEIFCKRPLKDGDGWAVFTTTGVMLVTDRNDSFIITMYLADIAKATAIFDGEIPKNLLKVLRENKKKGYVK